MAGIRVPSDRQGEIMGTFFFRQAAAFPRGRNEPTRDGRPAAVCRPTCLPLPSSRSVPPRVVTAAAAVSPESTTSPSFGPGHSLTTDPGEQYTVGEAVNVTLPGHGRKRAADLQRDADASARLHSTRPAARSAVRRRPLNHAPQYEYTVTDADGDTFTIRFGITVAAATTSAGACRVGQVLGPGESCTVGSDRSRFCRMAGPYELRHRGDRNHDQQVQRQPDSGDQYLAHRLRPLSGSHPRQLLTGLGGGREESSFTRSVDIPGTGAAVAPLPPQGGSECDIFNAQECDISMPIDSCRRIGARPPPRAEAGHGGSVAGDQRDGRETAFPATALDDPAAGYHACSGTAVHAERLLRLSRAPGPTRQRTSARVGCTLAAAMPEAARRAHRTERARSVCPHRALDRGTP